MTARERIEGILTAPGVGSREVPAVTTDIARALADEIDLLRARLDTNTAATRGIDQALHHHLTSGVHHA